MEIKILNLYAGIGGNRKLWTPKGNEHEIVAVEWDKYIAKVYQELYPKDHVIVCDAHKLLITCWDMIKDFDFIWSSPPCPTHSITNNYLIAQGCVRYPDMKLYEEIIFLKQFFKGKWVVENVRSYYEPLVECYEAERHYFWSNFIISYKKKPTNAIDITNASAETRQDNKDYLQSLEEYHGFDLSNFDIADKRKLLRNCVRPQLGQYIFNCAFKEQQQTLDV